MSFPLNPSERHAFAFHLLYAITSLSGFFLFPDSAQGHLIFGLVAAYNIALPVAGKLLGHDEWIQIWLFLVPLSLLQMLPDHILVSQLGTLAFPDLGSPRIGEVNLYMAGLWTIQLFLISFVGLHLGLHFSRKVALTGVVAASILILVASEATLPSIPIWTAEGVTKVGHVALYVVVPKIFLGIATFYAVERSFDRRALQNLGAAGMVTSFYLLSLLFFYQLIERLPAFF